VQCQEQKQLHLESVVQLAVLKQLLLANQWKVQKIVVNQTKPQEHIPQNLAPKHANNFGNCPNMLLGLF